MAKKYTYNGPGELPELLEDMVTALEMAGGWDTYDDPLDPKGAQKAISAEDRAKLESAAIEAYNAFVKACAEWAKLAGLSGGKVM
jgi:hypothetical protein